MNDADIKADISATVDCAESARFMKAFCLAVGFGVSPLQPMTLLATLADIQAAL